MSLYPPIQWMGRTLQGDFLPKSSVILNKKKTCDLVVQKWETNNRVHRPKSKLV